MSLHKLTAGDGYTYLTRQVAAHDVTQSARSGLADYYSERGEQPGHWWGSGLQGLGHGFAGAGSEVTEAQMLALFGVGRHPDTAAILESMSRAGSPRAAGDEAVRLGGKFPVYDAATAWRSALAARFAEHNAREGLPRDWPVPAADRARIRTELGTEMFTVEFGRPPAGPRELAGFIARASRQATTAVAGYDLTFTPVKSVSVLWALADPATSQLIEAAHDAAVADTLRWIEQHALFTRSGRAGVQQIDTTGMLAAVFTHRDARSGDPNLHTHVAVSNKVQALDGRWLAIDGRVLHKLTVAASERYNTRLEAQLRARLGLRFAVRPGTDPDKRPIREVVGVDARLADRWSARRTVIEARRAQLSAAFHAAHGRPPTKVEEIALAQQATLETRQGKHPPRSLAEQRTQWRTSAEDLLGGPAQVTAMLTAAIPDPAARQPQRLLAGRRLVTTVTRLATAATAAVEQERATWQACHLRAEAERAARAANLPVGQLDSVVDAAVEHALARAVTLGVADPLTDPGIEPAVLRRRGGESVYEVAGSQLFTTDRVLAAERHILAAAARTDGRTASPASVELALLEAAANGADLNPGQVQLVRQLATSPARVQLALAPAGTGKTTAMRVLARAWADDGGTVVGLAPSAAAAAVLRGEIGAHTDTLAKLTWSLDHNRLPAWAAGIGPRTLVIIDEAGMAATTDLAQVIDWITGRGGTVRLIGDDQQLASVASGGVLRDLAETHGAVTLSQVMRFRDPAEGAASLALRAGDGSALGYYLDQHRVHVGDQTTAADQLFTAWAADRAAGRDAIMLAPTRDLVAALNTRARQHRLTHTAASTPAGLQRRLVDGSACSPGDAIITRANDRRLPITGTDWVKNGDRWTVTAVHPDGSLRVQHAATRRRITLPSSYVRQHVTLGYATTVHGAQGITADTCHTLATGQETRQLLYVGLSRGRDANHLYLVTAGDGDPHAIITRDALLPPTAVDLLTRIISRDGAQQSATSAARDQSDPATQLTAAAARYHDALSTAAATTLGPSRLAAIDQAAELTVPGLTGHAAYPTLRAHLALLAVAGHDPAAELHAAATARPLGDAHDPAAVLDWRLDPTRRHTTDPGPLPWLPAIPTALRQDPQWGRYLTGRADHTAQLAAQVRDRAAAWTPATAPAWAAGLLDHDPALVADLAVWRAANDVDPADTTPAGPPPAPAAEAHAHRELTEQAAGVLGHPDHAGRRWTPLADQIDSRLAADPYWPQVAARLTAADRAGLDIAALTTAVAADQPLPDEHPAAALWWRLARHLSPAALHATDEHTASTLRPAWTPLLTDLLGQPVADRVTADPAWPALVAAVTDAAHHHWTPQQILTTAHDLLAAGQPGTDPLRAEEIATALIWRIGALTDPHAALDPAADRLPADPHDPTTPPSDPDPDITSTALHALPDALPVLDTDWLASLQPPDEASPEATLADLDVVGATNRSRPAAVTWVAEDANHDALYAHPTPRGGGIPADRLLELNRHALDYYRDRYPAGWAPGYLTARLGTDLAGDPRYTPGYAPPGWTHLTDHLRDRGATDDELLAAGLATRATSGRLIDRFRDRLILPIYNGDDLVGYIGRRNPTHDHDSDSDSAQSAEPKYLNTAETDLFSKGRLLYGLHEDGPLLAVGAAPVLVEGPLDAIAVTLTGHGHYTGVAPLGTAFTDHQADLLRPYLRADTPVIVGTDNDTGGNAAAERAYWQLTARGDNPHRLRLPTGSDPAQLLHTHGPDALYDALTTAAPLARILLDTRIAAWADHLDEVEARINAVRAAAPIIGALPPEHWLDHIDHLTTATGTMPGLAHLEVLDAGHAWITDPTGEARLRLSQPATWPADRSADRWTELAQTLDTRLIPDPGWIALSAALDRLHAAGYPVHERLPDIVAQQPLNPQRPAHDLRQRLLDEHPAAITPVPAHIRRLTETQDEQHAAATAHPDTPIPTAAPPRRGPSRSA